MRDQLNARLPTDVRVLRVEDAAGSANARWEATEKTYAYFVLCASAEALPELDAWPRRRVARPKLASMRCGWRRATCRASTTYVQQRGHARHELRA